LYLHCPNGRLTVYNPATVLAPEALPALRGPLRHPAKRLFRRHREELRAVETPSDNGHAGTKLVRLSTGSAA
jgi:hypothetical protein